ncbi:MAG: D-2-hydroxyacid dehydrogenase [Pseudomonadota bacterium]
MRHFLVHAKTFARIEEALDAYRQDLSPIVLDDEGDLKHPWGKSEADAMIVYGTQDAYFSPAVPILFQTAFSAKQLDWFQSSAAGIEHPMLQAIGQKAELYTSSHEQSDGIADWVIWASLDYFQSGPARRAQQAQKDWSRLPFKELCETRWLIIGFGAIGQATGRKLKALGAHVTGMRRSTGPSNASDDIVHPSHLHDELAKADAVLLCLPHTPETEDFANASFFDNMKADSLFLNVGRGALVDEDALLNGLNAGKPAHATLDVFKTEPLPGDSPFWSHPQVTITPHIAALTEAAKRRTDALFLKNLDAFRQGKPLKNTVPKAEFA